MKINLLMILILLCSCGKFKHEVSGVPTSYKIDAPHDFKLGPDFEKAAKFCDDRYGKDTPEAEACFQDYRTYTTLKIAIDLKAITSFCKESYTDTIDIQSCVEDITKLLESLTGSIK